MLPSHTKHQGILILYRHSYMVRNNCPSHLPHSHGGLHPPCLLFSQLQNMSWPSPDVPELSATPSQSSSPSTSLSHRNPPAPTLHLTAGGLVSSQQDVAPALSPRRGPSLAAAMWGPWWEAKHPQMLPSPSVLSSSSLVHSFFPYSFLLFALKVVSANNYWVPLSTPYMPSGLCIHCILWSSQ